MKTTNIFQHTPPKNPRSVKAKRMRFGILVVLSLLLGFMFYVLFSEGGNALKGVVAYFRPALILLWLFTGMAFAALFLLAYLIVRKVADKKEDPLFPIKGTLLLLVVLLRLAWEVQTVRATLIQAIRDSSGICQVIMVVFAIGLASCLLHFLWLKREYNGFLKVRSRLVSVPLKKREDMDEALSIMEEARGLLRNKWHNVKENLQDNLNSEYDTLITFPDQREFLKEGKVTFIIKILPIIGMVGTVLGFTVAVVGMQQAAGTMSDFTSFKGNLLQALGGMKTAFLTTLVGMVAMLLVMWVNSLIEQARRQVLSSEAEFLYMRLFLPLRKITQKPPQKEPDQESHLSEADQRSEAKQ